MRGKLARACSSERALLHELRPAGNSFLWEACSWKYIACARCGTSKLVAHRDHANPEPPQTMMMVVMMRSAFLSLLMSWQRRRRPAAAA